MYAGRVRERQVRHGMMARGAGGARAAARRAAPGAPAAGRCGAAAALRSATAAASAAAAAARPAQVGPRGLTSRVSGGVVAVAAGAGRTPCILVRRRADLCGRGQQ